MITKLSIVIPIYNEEQNIPELKKRLENVLNNITARNEIIFVDDGSRDKSLELLSNLANEDKRYKVISLSRNFGHQVAITAGLDYATGEAVVIMDGDLQDPPELIPKLYKKWQDGYEVVYAQREERKGVSWFKRFCYLAFYRILKRITRVDIPVDTGDFRLIDKRVVKILKNMPERQRFIRGLVSWVGFRQVGVAYERDSRYAGKPKYSYKKLIELAITGITSFSTLPLRLASYLGFIVSGLSFIYAVIVIYGKIVKNQVVQGWTSLMVAVLFLGGIQLITLGIIGEYVGRLSEETKSRPIYLIDKKINLDDDN